MDIEKNQELANTRLNMVKVATRVGQAFNFFMKIPLFEPLQQMCSEKRVGEIYLFKTFNEDLQ